MSAAGTTEPKLTYLDSSLALRLLLEGEEAARRWFESVAARDSPLVSSKLLELEVIRALRRDDRPLSVGDVVLDAVDILGVDLELFEEASAIEPHVKSLDALHLATALRIGTDLTVIATHDQNMKRVAEDLGFEVADPLA